MTKIEQIAQNIIEEYELNYNNAEIIADNEGCQMIVEAPNHATVTIDIYLNDIDKGNKEVKIAMLNKIADKIKCFDADDEFDEIWSYEFGKHNNFRPSQFLRMLLEDEDYFDQCSEKMYQEAEKLEHEIWEQEEQE